MKERLKKAVKKAKQKFIVGNTKNSVTVDGKHGIKINKKVVKKFKSGTEILDSLQFTFGWDSTEFEAIQGLIEEAKEQARLEVISKVEHYFGIDHPRTAHVQFDMDAFKAFLNTLKSNPKK